MTKIEARVWTLMACGWLGLLVLVPSAGAQLCNGHVTGAKAIEPLPTTIIEDGALIDVASRDGCFMRFDANPNQPPMVGNRSYGFEVTFEVKPPAGGYSELGFPLKLTKMGLPAQVRYRLQRRDQPLVWDDAPGSPFYTQPGGHIDIEPVVRNPDDYLQDVPGNPTRKEVVARVTLTNLVPSGNVAPNCEDTDVDHCDCWGR